MGHLTLIAEYVLVMLERYYRETLVKYAPLPEWEEYVRGRDNETKERGGTGGVARSLGSGHGFWLARTADADATTTATPRSPVCT